MLLIAGGQTERELLEALNRAWRDLERVKCERDQAMSFYRDAGPHPSGRHTIRSARQRCGEALVAYTRALERFSSHVNDYGIQ